MLEGFIRSKTARKILAILVSDPEEKYYVRQLERLTREPVSAVQRELRKFNKSGLLSSRDEARVKYYWINKDNPIFAEIKSIILKTQGVGDHLRGLKRVMKDKKIYVVGGEGTPRTSHQAKHEAVSVRHNLEQCEQKVKDFAREHPEILAAYLFGSLAQGTANKLSDIDVALLVDEAKVQESSHPYGYKASAIAEMVKLLKTNDIDIVMLNSAPPLLAQRIYAKGKLLYSRDEGARVANRVSALNRYLDLKILRSRGNGGRHG